MHLVYESKKAKKAKNGTRIFWRYGDAGAGGRAWGDFRDFADVDGKRERLPHPGTNQATKDPDVAAVVAAERVKVLEEKRRAKGLGVVDPTVAATLGRYAERHLNKKAEDGDGTTPWLTQAEHHLRLAIEFFGMERDLRTIAPEHLEGWIAVLRKRPSRKGGRLTDTTVRKILNSLSNLFARAVSDKNTTGVEFNPVAGMFKRPTAKPTEASYLEPWEAALFLESARTYEANTEAGAFAHMYPLVATFLLTGGRRAEVLGLMVDDVTLGKGKQLGRVTFRPNEFRRLKTSKSERSVPLWPQLDRILRAYFAERERSGGLGSLLFPAVGEGTERKLHDIRKPLDRIAEPMVSR